MDRRPPMESPPRCLRRRWTDPLPLLIPQSNSTRRPATPRTPSSPCAAKSPGLLPSATQVKSRIHPWPSACDELTPRSTPDYQQIVSSKLAEMAERAKEEFGVGGRGQSSSVSAPQSPLCQRGRLYDVYSARREEWLKRKKVEAAVAQDLGTAVQQTKRRDFKKQAAEPAAELSATRRSTLPRGSKDIKRPVTATTAATVSGSSAAATGRRTSTSYPRKL